MVCVKKVCGYNNFVSNNVVSNNVISNNVISNNISYICTGITFEDYGEQAFYIWRCHIWR